MSNVEKYAKERKEDVLPQSMKALERGITEQWAHWIGEAYLQKEFVKRGDFVLMVDRSRMVGLEARQRFCDDCVEWFAERGLAIKPTHVDFDKTNERLSEIRFTVPAPDAVKGKTLLGIFGTLAGALQEQAEIDSFFASRTG